jgi:GTP pyrophosphokinase
MVQGWSPSALATATGLNEERVRDICRGEPATPYELLDSSVMIRSVLAQNRPAEGGWLHGKVSDLETALRENHRGADLPLLHHAYQVAERLHRGQTRRSGVPYLTHPVPVAHTVADLGLDTTAVAATLLHDLVEDAAYTLTEVRADFGEAVAELVRGVRELDQIYLEAATREEGFPDAVRRMLLVARTDVRALIIKIAYRLHHMRTLRFRHGPSQVHTATATRGIVIPLADRLGLYAIRRELEDLVLAVLEPEIYRLLDDHLRKTGGTRRSQVAAAQAALNAMLQRSQIRAEVQDRPRHHYSVYRRMIKDPHREPQCPPRLVVVVSGNELDCYRALGVVHRAWRPVPGGFTDLIAAPKYNRYQSLHTTVVGPADQPMDVVVRTYRMHRLAEHGVAVDLSESAQAAGGPPRLDWLDRLLAWQEEIAEPELAGRAITIRTGDGTPVPLSANATSADLAYYLDPAAGDRLVGASVNGRLAPLTAPLVDGDVVELIHAQHGDRPHPPAIPARAG